MAGVAHKLIAATAREMAEALFEEWARENSFHAAFRTKKARALFVSRVAPKLFEDARRALTSMLGDPNIPESTKEQIYEAILLDATFRAKRLVAADAVKLPH